MTSSEKLDEISEDSLKSKKIITITLNLGISIFALSCFYLYQNNISEEADNVDFMNLLLIALWGISIVCYLGLIILSKNLFMKILKTSKDNVVIAFNIFHFVRLSLLELPAFFGLIVLLLSI